MTTLTNSPVSLSSMVAGNALALCDRPDALFAVLDHLAQLGHLGREVDDAERRLPAAIDVAAIDGSIIVEELEVLFLDGRVERLQVRPANVAGEGAEEGLVHFGGELPVAFVAQMDAVDRQGMAAGFVQLLAGSEQVDEDHAVLCRPARPWRRCRA